MNFEKYLAKSNYSWKDMFVFLVDEGHMHNMLKEMMDDGMLDELNPDDFDRLVDYLDYKLKSL